MNVTENLFNPYAASVSLNLHTENGGF